MDGQDAAKAGENQTSGVQGPQDDRLSLGPGLDSECDGR